MVESMVCPELASDTVHSGVAWSVEGICQRGDNIWTEKGEALEILSTQDRAVNLVQVFSQGRI